MTNRAKQFVVQDAPWVLNWVAEEFRKSPYSLRNDGDHLTIVDEVGRREIWLSRANTVYAPDMANSFEYYFSSVESELRDGISVVDFSVPREHKLVGFDDFPLVFPSLAEPHQTCSQYLDFAELKPGDVVIDLGGYSGTTAIEFSKAVGPEGLVIVAEPDPVNANACRENFSRHATVNDLENIVLEEAAVSDQAGTISFSAEGAMGASSVDIVGDYRGDVIEVAAVTLADLIEKHAIDRLAFLKIDIEGAETGVIRTSETVLRSLRPRVVIEPHIVGGELNAAELTGLLEGYGYSCQTIEQFGVTLPLVTATPQGD